MVTNISVYGIKKSEPAKQKKIAEIHDVEIDWRSESRIYFRPDQWAEVTAAMNALGYSEEELRFLDTNKIKNVSLIAPHNEPQIMCLFVGGKMNGLHLSLEEVEKLTARRSSDLTDLRSRGALCRRQELDNKPAFSDYCGPMWDGIRSYGTIELRYESQDVYDSMCD